MTQRWIVPLAVSAMLAGALFFVLGARRGSAAIPSYSQSQSFSAGDVLGPVPRRMTHEFRVRNDRSEPIEIKEVKMDCSCTAWSAPKRIIQPGETGTIEIDLTLNGSGPTSSTADVFWSTGERTRLIFAAHAKVPREMFLSTYSMELQPGAETSFSLTFVDQQGWQPPPAAFTPQDRAEVQIGPWQRVTPDDTLGGTLASRFMAVGTIRLTAALDDVVRVKFSLPDAGIPDRELVVRTPELVKRFLEQRTLPGPIAPDSTQAAGAGN